MNLEKIYDKNYKKLLLIPLILLALSIIFLAVNYARTGSVIERDVSLKGGISMTIEKEGLNEEEISSFLNSRYNDINVRVLTDLSTRKNIGLIIESSDVSKGNWLIIPFLIANKYPEHSINLFCLKASFLILWAESNKKLAQ